MDIIQKIFMMHREMVDKDIMALSTVFDKEIGDFVSTLDKVGFNIFSVNYSGDFITVFSIMFAHHGFKINNVYNNSILKYDYIADIEHVESGVEFEVSLLNTLIEAALYKNDEGKYYLNPQFSNEDNIFNKITKIIFEKIKKMNNIVKIETSDYDDDKKQAALELNDQFLVEIDDDDDDDDKKVEEKEEIKEDEEEYVFSWDEYYQD